MTKLLSVNEEINLASDPYIPLFRQFRNAVIERSNDPEVVAALDPNTPLDDYYFSPIKHRTMLEIQESSLEIPYDQSQHADLLQALERRTSLGSGDLVPFLSKLTGETFLELFRNSLRIIGTARQAESCTWVGFNENWAVDFFVPLAKGFPEARFMIVLRDPRAAIASGLRVDDGSKVPHLMSFVRCWRKYVAFVQHLKTNPVISERLFVINYEDLTLDPEKWARKMSDFLEVKFHPAMLDPNNFTGADGGQWQGNSHYGNPTGGIYSSSIDAWKSHLPRDIIETIELICGHDMALLGYDTMEYSGDSFPSKDALRFLADDSAQCQGWRTDFGDIERDVGSEMFRNAIIVNDPGNTDDDLIGRCFLFKEAYLALMAHKDKSRTTADGIK